MNSTLSSTDRQSLQQSGGGDAYAGGYSGAGENIYNWIKREEPPAPKLPMYRSKYNPKDPPVRSTFNDVTKKKPAATMGRTTKDTIHPKQYLKAHERTGEGQPDKTKRKS